MFEFVHKNYFILGKKLMDNCGNNSRMNCTNFVICALIKLSRQY